MTYSANRNNRKGSISSWFWATAPAGTSITVEADDNFTFYPLRDAETGLPATLSASTTTPGKPPAQYVPAEATGSVISSSRTKYFYSTSNDGGDGYFSASGFTEVENFDTSEHFLAVNASAHSGRVCEWLGEMGYAVNTGSVPAWLTLSLDTAGASYTVAANTTGAERVADVEFLAYSGQSMAVQIRQLATATPTRSRTEWRPATPPAGTPQVNYKLISYSPNPLHAGYSGYVSFRYSYEKIWTQEEFLIVEKLSADGKTVLLSTATKTATPPRQTKQTFYASGSQHKAGATDPNIVGNALSLYSANGNYVGSAPLTSSGGGGNGGSGSSGSSGNSGGSGTGTGGAGTGTGGAGTLPETVQELEFSALGGSVPLRVNHSQADRDIIEGASAEWIAVSDEFFGAEIKRNTEKTPRTGTLKIRHETLIYYGERSEWVAASRTIYNITQRGIFYVVPETLQIPCEGGEASVEFKNGVPVGVDKGFAESAGTDGKIRVPANPICVFCDGAQVYAFDIIWTAESTETFTQRVEIAAPGTTARTLTVSPEETATSGGNVTVAASHPENETCDLSAGSAYAASLVSLTKNAGKTEAVYSLSPAPANTRIALLALFTAAANCRNAHTGILGKSVVFRGEESGGEDTGTGGGENSGTEGEGGEAGDSGENPGDGDEPETPPPGEELSLTGDRSRFTCEAARLTLTATATAGIDLSAAQLLIPDDASEWITVIGTPVTDGNTKAWKLLITANFTEQERAAALAVYAGTLAAAFRISQKYFPRRAAAFYRNKRLWKPTFF